eukprot:6576719-Prymnesium_polylepis.2
MHRGGMPCVDVGWSELRLVVVVVHCCIDHCALRTQSLRVRSQKPRGVADSVFAARKELPRPRDRDRM